MNKNGWKFERKKNHKTNKETLIIIGVEQCIHRTQTQGKYEKYEKKDKTIAHQLSRKFMLDEMK